MSREVDKSDLSKLSQDDLLYLRDRGDLTADQEREFLSDVRTSAPQAPDLSETEYTGDENTAPSIMEDAEDEDDLDSMTKAELEDEAENLGVSKSGNKQELIARIREARGEEEE